MNIEWRKIPHVMIVAISLTAFNLKEEKVGESIRLDNFQYSSRAANRPFANLSFFCIKSGIRYRHKKIM